MSDHADVVVLGGGPAGYAAALAAAGRGASVVLVEPERPGGQCVHYACIPTAALLSAIVPWVEAQELSVMGVADVGELDLARAVSRKDSLVARLSGGVAAALGAAGVEVVAGIGSFAGADAIQVGERRIHAGAIVLATGTRWDEPALAGVPAGKVVTADVVQSLGAPPASALVLGDGPADTAFAVEYAYLLAAAGSTVTYAARGGRVVPALDADLDDLAAAVLTDMGVTVADRDGELPLDADLILAADPRRPSFEAAGPEAAGVRTSPDGIAVDRGCRTNVRTVFAAGDVTGGAMTSAAATHMGTVAGITAAGGDARTSVHALPHVLHTSPGIGWVGMSEVDARAAGHDVAVGVVDLSWSARAITLGGRGGAVKLVADRRLGAVLGVHVVGPDVAEVLAVAAQAVAAELTIDDVAATVHWHPSAAEAIADAARDALRS